MTYEELPNRDFIPARFNQTAFITENDINDVVFSLKFQIAKCENMDNVNRFINSIDTTGMFFFCKDERVRQPIGMVVSSYYASLNKFIEQKDNLENIVKKASSAGFKGHDAKNLYMNITLRSGDIDNKTKKKIDLFVNLHPMFMKSISRRIKANKMNYNIDKDYSEFGMDSTGCNSSPIVFNNDTIMFRMFRSTLNVDTILSSIEFCKLLYEFCKNEIYIDDLLENNHVETFFNDYINSKSIYFKNYLHENKIECKRENEYFHNDSNLNNGFTNCSDVNLANNIEDDYIENDSWEFFKGRDTDNLSQILNRGAFAVRNADRVVGFVVNNENIRRGVFEMDTTEELVEQPLSHVTIDHSENDYLRNSREMLNEMIEELVEQNTEINL